LPLSAIYCSGMAMIRDRVAALRAATVYEPRVLRHIVSCVRLNGVEGGVVRSQGNFALFESLSDREPHLLMSGRYVDKVIREGAELKFKERICVYDNYRVRTSIVMPV
jgi:anthranilate 1,2-dioxygenase small subunit